MATVAVAMAVLGLAVAAIPAAGAERPTVVVNGQSPLPAPGATDVSPETIVRVRFSAPVDPATVSGSTFRLVESSTAVAVATGVALDVFGEVATLTPSARLRTSTSYTMSLTDGIRAQSGEALVPYGSSFTTGATAPASGLTFAATRFDGRDRNTSLAFGPDANLYVADIVGQVRRYRIDPATGAATTSDIALALPSGRRMLGIAFDPGATAANLILWVSYAVEGAGRFEGVVSRFALAPFGGANPPTEQSYVIGLPNRDGLSHMTNGLAFGPDGRLYIAQGGATGAGGTSSEGETESPLSAAVLRADVNDAGFGGGSRPVDVSPQAGYDPFAAGAPVTLFATGLRNTYDLVWHSNGQAYAGTNETGGNALTPACGGAPAINGNPPDSLVRLAAGAYYGHPNPSRGECVLKGGNPTAGPDPLEVVEYPVGIAPEPAFDPRQHHRFNPSDCISPNGVAEYTRPGPAQGWVLIACFAGGQRIQALRLDPAGDVVEERPLRSPDGEVIRFAGALDVAVDPSGRVYVADFGEDGGSARVPGAVWMLEPDEEAPPTPGGGPAFVSASRAAASGSSVSISRPTGLSTGHVLVAVVRQKKTTAAVTPPAGWTLIRSDSQSARSSLFFRVVTASEPSQYRFKVGTSAKLEGHILAYSGVDPADPVAASGVGSNTGTASGPTVVAPSLTPPLANTTYVAFWSAKASGLTVAAAAGTTERTDTSANATLATADETLSTTSPSGARTATLTSASDRRIGQAVLLRPAP